MRVKPARPTARVGFPLLLPIVVSLSSLVGLSSCSDSSSATVSTVLLDGTIGPAGGVLAVSGGVYDGLALTVEPGVLDREIPFRIIDDTLGVASAPQAPGQVIALRPPVGYAFRIEPSDLVLTQNVRLLIPYLPQNIVETAPGNVLVRQTSPFVTRDITPAVVDVGVAQVELETKTFGRFEPVPGEVLTAGFYLPAREEVQQLEGGYSFVIEDVDPSSPWAVDGADRWRIEGPGFGEDLIVSGLRVLGREAANMGWREVWAMQMSLLRTEFEVQSGPIATTMLVEQPAGGLGLGASLMFLAFVDFTFPRALEGVSYRNVIKYTIDVAYNRPDLGQGERRLILWCAPDVGLLRLSIDGVVRDRVF
ncbi:MAG: hypothetical protein AB8H80_16065 [Planctomycetota bacterium]